MQTGSAIYRQRRPETTDLYRIVAENLDLFIEVFDERFLSQHGPLPLDARHAFEAFLRCGRALFGFARIRCESCGDELLLPFRCQRVGLCPSCQHQRAEVLQRFLTDHVIAPVPHRQLVFVLPKRLRRSFYRDPELLTGPHSAIFITTTRRWRGLLSRGLLVRSRCSLRLSRFFCMGNLSVAISSPWW